MIAACPKCQAKYRVDAERLSPEGARLRCAKCQAVFRVRAPAAPPQAVPAPAAAPPQAAAAPAQMRPAAAPSHADAATPVDRDRLVLVADPDVETGKLVMSTLASWGLQPILVHDGVEALLTIQRMLPRAAILDAALPKMYGFQICEMVKRNDSLRSIHVVLVGSVHHQDRYRRPPSDLYGADAYMEKPELPDGLGPVLARFGYRLAADVAAPPAAAPRPQAPRPAPAPAPRAPAAPPPQPTAAQPAAADDVLGEHRANAERLARIIVSDILLYHPEEFKAGLASGRLAQALDSALHEGRGFFAQRVDPRVRDERDFIMDELQRVARERAGR